MTYTFDNGTDSVSFSGVLFTVTVAVPTVTLEWLDADGDWIDGNSTALPMLASTNTVGRCVVTNNSNAPGTLVGSLAWVDHPSDPTIFVPIVATLAAGATQAFTFYTGPVSNIGSYTCAVGILFPSASGGTGNSNGGAVVPIAGTLSASPLSVDPGGTVTVTGAGLLPNVSDVFTVTVDGVPAPGSPATLDMPGGVLSFDVEFPTAGSYTLAIHNEYNSRTITFASFTVIAGGAGLANTGTESSILFGLMCLLLVSGAALLFARSRRA